MDGYESHWFTSSDDRNVFDMEDTCQKHNKPLMDQYRCSDCTEDADVEDVRTFVLRVCGDLVTGSITGFWADQVRAHLELWSEAPEDCLPAIKAAYAEMVRCHRNEVAA